MDWSGLIYPILAAVASLLVGYIGALKTVVPRMIETRLAERETKIREAAEAKAYERTRSAFREDKTFDMLDETLKWLKGQTEAQLEQNRIFADSIARLAKNIQQNTDITRLLAQQSAQVEDRLRDIEMELDRQFNGRRTKKDES